MAYRPVEVLSQTIKDIKDDTRFTARWIGPSTLNETRLTVNSAMTRFNDKFDVYRFRNTRDTTELAIRTTADKNIRLELINNKGQVVADTAAKEGPKKEGAEALAIGKFEAAKGYYYVRVSRGEGMGQREPAEYFFQITNGQESYTDYDTIETPPPSTSTVAASTYNTQIAASTLQAVAGSSILGEDNFFTKLRSIYGSVVDVNA